MATKLVCDGCGDALIKVQRTLVADVSLHRVQADLCSNCFDRILAAIAPLLPASPPGVFADLVKLSANLG